MRVRAVARSAQAAPVLTGLWGGSHQPTMPAAMLSWRAGGWGCARCVRPLPEHSLLRCVLLFRARRSAGQGRQSGRPARLRPSDQSKKMGGGEGEGGQHGESFKRWDVSALRLVRAASSGAAGAGSPLCPTLPSHWRLVRAAQLPSIVDAVEDVAFVARPLVLVLRICRLKLRCHPRPRLIASIAESDRAGLLRLVQLRLLVLSVLS